LKAEEAPPRLPPRQRLGKGWPVLHYGPLPSFDRATWNFKVWGALENPLKFSYEEFRSLPVVKVRADFHCVTKFSVLDNEWEGVAFREVSRLVGPRPNAKHVMVHSEYGYDVNLPLAALMEEDVLFAWARNGEPLSVEHGFPLRLVVPSRYAWKSAKWVRGVEFLEQDRRGFWEARGYHNNADPWAEERYSYQEERGT
jgi:DMSO/TMAO reductase YedYZ molybdopterin-dependent catalytic subunit